MRYTLCLDYITVAMLRCANLNISQCSYAYDAIPLFTLKRVAGGGHSSGDLHWKRMQNDYRKENADGGGGWV